jgi:preprotein translocase subunit SecE
MERRFMSRGTDNPTFLENLLSGALYKRNQGRLVRRLTLIALAATVLIGCWTMSLTVLSEQSAAVRHGVAWGLAGLGLWVAFRTVNFPQFANFLIAVEGEMDKVSWSDADYLRRATGVVIGTMLFLGAILWAYDFFWFRLFSLIRILDADALQG